MMFPSLLIICFMLVALIPMDKIKAGASEKRLNEQGNQELPCLIFYIEFVEWPRYIALLKKLLFYENKNVIFNKMSSAK